MELPHLGKNCALKQCNQLDFLPVKCDACLEVFCLHHYQYDTHNCEKAKNRNVQVPVCPLCSEPVVSKRNELPDVAVSTHIDQYCKRNESVKSRLLKPKSNLQSCTFKSCKQKDVIYLQCNDCRSKYCIKHRHPTDHSCPGPSISTNLAGNWQSFKGSCSSGASSSYELIKNKAQQISRSGQAALNRLGNTSVASTAANSSRSLNSRNAQVTKLQGSLSEQDALAIALNESKANGGRVPNQPTNRQETEDEALARAIHESQIEASNRANRTGNDNKDSCVLS